ncbi:unnamed protein product [Natator depressus]
MPSALAIQDSQEPSYPKPNISLHPSGGVAPGGAVTVQCECRCRGARVLLYKAGDPEARQGKDPPEDVAQFSIHNVSQRDAGSYSCRYSIKSDLSVWSEPSDAMELVVAAAAPPGCPDFTHPDIAHLALSTMVLLIVGLILAEAHYSRPRVEPGSSRAEKKISTGDELFPLAGVKRRHKTSCSQTPLPR